MPSMYISSEKSDSKALVKNKLMTFLKKIYSFIISDKCMTDFTVEKIKIILRDIL